MLILQYILLSKDFLYFLPSFTTLSHTHIYGQVYIRTRWIIKRQWVKEGK